MKFAKTCMTLDKAMQVIGVRFRDGCEPFIAYDPAVKPQYRIIRQHAHDGTLLFTRQLVAEALEPLLHRYSYFKPEPPAEGYEPFYTIGEIRIATVYGRVDLPAGRCSGQRERITIPVRVEWRLAARAEVKP